MSPEETENHENDEGASGPLDQADLDALISQMAGGGDESAPEPESAEAAPESGGEPDLLDQSDLDALISQMAGGGGETTSAPEPAPPEPSPESGGESDLLDQSDLDALVSQKAGDGGEAAPEPESADTAPDSGGESDLLDQSDLDALVSQMAGDGAAESEPEPPAAEAEAADRPEKAVPNFLDQSELDSLIQGMEDSSPKFNIPEPSEKGPAPEVTQAALLDQAELDALISGMAEGGEEEAEPEDAGVAPPEEAPAEDGGLLDQAALDALISGLADEPAAPVEPTPVEAPPEPDSVPEESKTLSQAELDNLLAGPEAEKALDDKELDAEIVSAADGADSGMDTVIGAGEEGGAIDQADIDALIAGAAAAQEPEPEPEEVAAGGLSEQAAIDALIAGAQAEEAPAPEVPPAEAASVAALETGGADQELGSENLAAAGTAAQVDEGSVTQDAIDDLIKGALSAAPEEEAPAAEAEEAQEAEEKEEEPGLQIVAGEEEEPEAEGDKEKAPKKKRRFRPKSKLKIPIPKVAPQTLVKGGLSLAAGLVFGFSTYVVLQNLPRRVPTQIAEGIAPSTDLRQAVTDAANLMQGGRYAEAMKILEPALAGAPTSPLREDAEFMMAEAAYRALPAKPSEFEFEVANSLMANVVDRGYDNPRLIDLLRWKAELYGRMDLPDAALRVHDKILTTFSPVPHLDEVLLGAAKYALQLGRSAEATDLLRRHLQQFPGSRDAVLAKLMLGEALLDSGGAEEGQGLLRQVAVSQPHSALGAKAYARLGELAFDEGKYETAIGELEKRLSSSTTIEGNDEILLMLARAYRETGRPEKARAALRDLIQFFPGRQETPQLLMELSEVLDDLGQREEALRVAGQAARQFPDNPDVLLNYARLRELSGDLFSAAQTLLAADAAGAKDPALLLTAGRQLLEAGYLSDAHQVFEQLEAGYPDSPEGFAAALALAKVARNEGRIRAALNRLEDLAQATKDTPQELPVLLPLGEMYLELGLNEPAAGVYRRLAAATAEPEILGQAAIALLNASAWSEGLSIAHRVDPAQLTKPTAHSFLMAQGQALLRGDAQLAVASMEQAQQDYPDQRSFKSDRQLLDAYLATDQLAKARILVMDMTSRVQPIDVDVVRSAAIAWGDHLHEKGDFRGAASAYEVALGLDERETPDALWAKFQRANALLALNDITGSLQLFEELAGTGSEWSESAKVKVHYLRLRQRLAGTNVPAPSVQG